MWYRCKWGWSEAVLQSLAVVVSLLCEEGGSTVVSSSSLTVEVSEENPFVEASNSEGRRTGCNKKREESHGFCSLDSWKLRHACGFFRMEGEMWTQLRHRQRGDEFCWRAEAIRDMRRLAGKHTFHSLATAWRCSPFHQFLCFVSSCCFELFQNVILRVAVMVEDGHSPCYTCIASFLVWIQLQHMLL